MKQDDFITRAKMLYIFKKFIAETQGRAPEYMKHVTYKVRSQEAAWGKYLLHV